ncbi:MAG: RimK/LysX family protein [Bacteroidetes bacterium]|nr:RimK/LysX family protein [Bacteroidota bacterium]
MERIVIGRKDKADLPLFKLVDIPVKIDTGAYTSSIHCDQIDKKTIDGKEILEVVFFSMNKEVAPTFQFDTFSEKRVRSSTGEMESRYIIQGNIELFGKVFKTPFSLSKRMKMKYPVLLGRKLLNRKFVVDSAKTNLSCLKKLTAVYIR